jgi:peroxiredoxin
MLRETKYRARATGRLVAIDPSAGEPLEFVLLKAEVSLGSDETNDFAINSGSVSRRHAIIRSRAGRYEVTDLNSTNGTFVNGQRVKGSIELERGDELRIGGVRFVVAAPNRDTSASGSRRVRRRWFVSGRTIAEIILVAFVIGFGSAQYLAYITYGEQNRLLLGKTVPVPAGQPQGTNGAGLRPALPQRAESAAAAPRPRSSAPRAAGTPVESTSAMPARLVATIPAEPNPGMPGRHDSNIVAAAVSLTSLVPGSGSDAGQLAPDFGLVDLSGRKVSLSALRGKVIFLNVWATWCPVCRREMPAIQKLYDEFKNYPDFRLMAVSEDQNQAAVAPFIGRNGYQFPVLLDPGNQVDGAYGVLGLPSTFIIDRSGRVIWNYAGGLDWSSPNSATRCDGYSSHAACSLRVEFQGARVTSHGGYST